MKNQLLATSIASALAVGLTALPAHAEEQTGPLSGLEEDTSITLSGTIVEEREDEFDLMVGAETVTVDIEDDIRDGGAYTLLPGDRVTVTGQVEDHFFQGRELEATAMHIDKIGTTFILDEDYADKYGMVSGRMMDDYVQVSGVVKSVDDDEFRIHTRAGGDFTVEVDELADNPLDDDGYMKIRVGDSVNVFGEIDDDWIEGREIVASSVDVLRVGVIVE
ncbi:hypothetical protein HFP89_06190 [Wenzhouxiangella sp. XN79A]|uniref:hypothetical protein n=1 Tax=Wenzhouxiangella sp. XN79A TaxID=2724193 RepID=UPI00144A60EE|nr:hypothetical protein [Wenzhouxiangella sp. XN79A]NKI34751.1 hypothetical protein [Wenzhouxiangella sp. XN79A]